MSDLTPLERCYGYADSVLSGDIVACEKVKLACRRFREDLKKQEDPGYPWRFDETKAARPVRFIEQFLKPIKGDYDKMELMPWQCFVECNIFGWVDKETGLRRYNEALIIVGSGNGKSTLMAGNATYLACKDSENGPEIYLLANSKEQAGIVFNECLEEIRHSPALDKRFRTLRDGVYYDAVNAVIKARASDSRKLDGLNPHGAIFDEIHEYNDFKLIDIIRKKLIKRSQPIIFFITTMGYVLDGPLVYYYDLYTQAMEGHLKPKVADRMFAFIAELDDHDDIEDRKVWIKANPSLGGLLSMERLEEDWERSKLIPQQRAAFICKQLNIMVNADAQAFLQPEVLRTNDRVIDMQSLEGCRCYGGFDLSDTEDFTAAALEFPMDDGSVFCLLHSWVPRAKVERDQEKIDYYGLAMQGYLSICDGEHVDQREVYEWFKAKSEIYQIVAVGYDVAKAIALRQMMEARGFDMQVVRQGVITLNGPMQDLKERFIDRKVISNKDPMLLWYTDNVKISNDRKNTEKGNMYPTKQNKYRKIDGFMAFLDAHAIYLQRELPLGVELPEPSINIIDLKSLKTGRR